MPSSEPSSKGNRRPLRGCVYAAEMRKRVAIPLAIGAGVVAAAPRMFKRAWKPPRREVHQSPTDFGLTYEQVWLNNVSGIQLSAWFVPAADSGPAPIVVVMHGWGGNAAHMLPLAQPLFGANFHTLFVDARNHGLSDHDDHVSMLRFAEDLGTGIDYVRTRSDVTDVAVVAHSVGAAAAIYYASYHDNISSVVAVASFAHPGELMSEALPLPKPVKWIVLKGVERTIGQSLDQIAPRQRIEHVTVPLMLVHGGADNIVSVANAQELHAARPSSELLIVPDGGHSDLGPFEPVFPQVIEFIRSHSNGQNKTDQ